MLLPTSRRNPFQKHTFKKEERLAGKKNIEQIFRTGQSFFHFPFKVIFLSAALSQPGQPARILIAVSKRYYRRATDRNRIKRIIREAYRRHKVPFYDFLTQNQRQCAVVLLYNSKETITFMEAEKKIIEVLRRLQQHIR